MLDGPEQLLIAALLLALWRPRQTARLFRAAGFLEGDQETFLVNVMRLLAALSLAGVAWAGAAQSSLILAGSFVRQT